MTEKAVAGSLEVVYATDTYKDAIGKVYDVLDDIYEEVNLLYKMSYTTNGTAPANAETGLLWLDGSTATPVLKYNAGTSGSEDWQIVATSAAFGSGLSLDAAFEAFSHRVILDKTAAAIVSVAASPDLPATIFITDHSAGLLQNTASVSVTISGAAGVYDIWARRNGSGTDFILDKVAHDGTPTDAGDDGQRKIGEVYWDGAAITTIRSDEVMLDGTERNTPYGYASVYLNASPGSGWITTAYKKIEFDTKLVDTDSCFNLAQALYTTPRAGIYEIEATVNVDPSAAARVFVAFYANSSIAGESITEASTTASHGHIARQVMKLAVNTTLDVYIKLNSGTGTLGVSYPNKTAFTVKYLGPY